MLVKSSLQCALLFAWHYLCNFYGCVCPAYALPSHYAIVSWVPQYSVTDHLFVSHDCMHHHVSQHCGVHISALRTGLFRAPMGPGMLTVLRLVIICMNMTKCAGHLGLELDSTASTPSTGLHWHKVLAWCKACDNCIGSAESDTGKLAPARQYNSIDKWSGVNTMIMSDTAVDHDQCIPQKWCMRLTPEAWMKLFCSHDWQANSC